MSIYNIFNSININPSIDINKYLETELTNHNFNNDRYHVTRNLPCGADTRYLNKKMA